MSKRKKLDIKIKEEQFEYDSPQMSETDNSNNGICVKEEVKKENTGHEQYIEVSTNSVPLMDHTINYEKSKALTKDETRGLLELILQHPIITSKENNATNNQQKIIEWNQIAHDFNANYGVYPRTAKQLRLKWENMKKNARRRNAKIKMNRGKTDLTAEYIPRNAILEKVSTLLRRQPSATTATHDSSSDSNEDTPLVLPSAPVTPTNDTAEHVEPPQSTVSETVTSKVNGFTGLTPRKKKFRLDEGREARNRAIAGYYSAKTRLLDANHVNTRLQNEKLRLEIELLKRSIH